MRKFCYREIPILASLILLFGLNLQAQRPPKALVGITAGGMYLIGGNGAMFEGSSQQAHRTWGWGAGASIYRYLNDDLHLNLTGLVVEEQGHVHPPSFQDQGLLTVPFSYRALHGSITLNHQGGHLGKRWVLKEFAGFGFNVGNLLDNNVQNRFGDMLVITERRQEWRADPEFIVGAGLVSRMTSWGNIHYTLSFHLDLFENQVYEASYILENQAPVTVTRPQRDINIMLTATYFIRIPKRGNRCTP